MEPYASTLTESHRAVLKMLSLELANGKRIEELLVLRHLLTEASWSTAALAKEMTEQYRFLPSTETMESVARLLDLQFFTKTARKNTVVSRLFPLRIMRMWPPPIGMT